MIPEAGVDALILASVESSSDAIMHTRNGPSEIYITYG
jgi:hypothetical protein